MDFIQILILSIVEGVTEFLPVSSTGHLVLTSHLLSIPQTEFVKSFEIIIQLGAILAVVVLYWKKFFDLRKGLAINRKVWLNVTAAFIPTAVIGLILYKLIKSVLLGNEMITVLALLIGGVLLIILEKIHSVKQSPHPYPLPKERELNDINYEIENLSLKQCLGIGLAQSVSIIPGVSRSAASILGGMFLGLRRQTAVEFSFLLAIPTMMAASGLDLIKSDFAFSSNEWMTLAVGFIGAFIVALISVKWFIKFIQKNTFVPFGIYRIIAAILYFIIVLR